MRAIRMHNALLQIPRPKKPANEEAVQGAVGRVREGDISDPCSPEIG
jgi:hypothetical protein